MRRLRKSAFLSQLYKTTECWQNNTGLLLIMGKNHYHYHYAFKMLRKFFILLQNILLDTLINPLDSSLIFKMNLVINGSCALLNTESAV